MTPTQSADIYKIVLELAENEEEAKLLAAKVEQIIEEGNQEWERIEASWKVPEQP